MGLATAAACRPNCRLCILQGDAAQVEKACCQCAEVFEPADADQVRVLNDGDCALEFGRGFRELFAVEGGLALGVERTRRRWRQPSADVAEGGTNPWRHLIARLKQRIGRYDDFDDVVGFLGSPQSGQAEDAIQIEITPPGRASPSNDEIAVSAFSYSAAAYSPRTASRSV